MALDPERPLGSLALSLGALLVRGVLAGLGATGRTRIVEGERALEDLRRGGGPAIVCFWHESAVLGARFVRRELHDRGLPLTLLASRSGDGELVARVARGWGVPAVRGSSSRGGRSALRGLYRSLSKEGHSPLMIPDGPRGPRYAFKHGVTVLAQMSGAPILPLGFAVTSGRRLGSWDRLVLPRPFATTHVAIGEPRTVPRDLDAASLERVNGEAEDALQAVARRAWEECPEGPDGSGRP